MIYEKYEKRIKRIHTVKKAIYKLRFVLISVALLSLTLFFFLFSTKGMIIQESLLKNEYTYGEIIHTYSKAFLDSSVSYQFRKADQETWSYDLPKTVGTYQMRSCSKGNYGNDFYGKTQTFKIVPSPLNLTFKEDHVSYGKQPTIEAKGLVNGDSVFTYDVDYKDITKETTEVQLKKDSLIIYDKDGNDVTSCYSYDEDTKKNITLDKIPFHVYLQDNSKVYDGDVLRSDPDKVTYDHHELAFDDRVKELTPAEGIIDAGTTSAYLCTFKIVNSEGKDVTLHYDLIPNHVTLTVSKRPLTLQSQDFSYTYDGTIHQDETITVTDDGGLVQGHHYEVENLTSDDGKVGKKQIRFRASVKDQNGKDVSNNYHITYQYGTLSVLKRPLTLEVSSSYVYRSDRLKKTLEEKDYTITQGSLAEGETLKVYQNGFDENGEIDYDAKVLAGDGSDVTSQYQIDFTDRRPEIRKKTVDIRFDDVSSVFDGTYHQKESYTMTVKDADGLTSSLDHEDHILIQNYPSLLHSGEIENRPEVKILDSQDNDVTSDYDLNIVPGKITVTKRKAAIRLKSVSTVYDGNYHSVSEYEEFLPEGVTSSPDYGLLTNHSLTFVPTLSDIQIKEHTLRDYTITLDNGKPSGKFEDTANLHYSILSDEQEDFTSDYDLDVSDVGYIRIAKRPISISFSPMTHYYDGSNVNPEEYASYVSLLDSTSLVSGHKVKVTFPNSTKEIGTHSSPVDLNSIRIVDSNGSDVTDNYEIKLGTVGDIQVKKSKIVIKALISNPSMINEDGSYVIGYDGKEHSIDLTKTSDYKIDSTESDYPFGYTLKLSGKESGILPDQYTLKVQDATLTPSPNTYNYPVITKDMMDISFYKQSNHFEITSRNLPITMNSFTFWMGNNRAFDDDYLNSHSSQLFNYSLPEDHTIHFYLKKPLDIKEGTTVDLSGYIGCNVYDAKGNDVTGTGVSVSFENPNMNSVSFKKMHVVLYSSTGTTVEKEYDGQKQTSGISVYGSRGDYPDDVSFTVTYVDTRQDMQYYLDTCDILLKDVTTTYDSHDFSYQNGDVVIDNLDEMRKLTFRITKRKTKFSINNAEFKDVDPSTKDNIIWYDGRKVSFREEDKDALNLFKEIQTDGLANGDVLSVSLKEVKSLPGLGDTFTFSDYFRIRIINKTTGQDVSINYEAYDETKGEVIIDPVIYFNIRKIKLRFTSTAPYRNDYHVRQEAAEARNNLTAYQIDEAASEYPAGYDPLANINYSYQKDGTMLSDDTTIGNSIGTYTSDIKSVSYTAIDGKRITSDKTDGIIDFSLDHQRESVMNQIPVNISLKDYQCGYLKGSGETITYSDYLNDINRSIPTDNSDVLTEQDQVTLKCNRTFDSYGTFHIKASELTLQVTRDGIDVSDEYKPVFDRDELTVTIKKETLNLSLQGSIKQYDGTGKTYSVKSGSTDDGKYHFKQINIILDDTPVKVGTYTPNVTEIKVSIDGSKWFTGDDLDIHYTVTGTITIRKRALKIMTPSLFIVYDGKEHNQDEKRYTTSYSRLASGDTIEEQKRADVSFVKLGNYENRYEIKVHNKNGEDVTDCYNITYSYGTIHIIDGSNIEF